MSASTDSSFGSLPATADTAVVQPYSVHMADEDVENMKTLIKLSRIAAPAYENSLPDGTRSMGLRRDWLVQAKDTWEHNFDWRQHEERINSFPHFWAKVPLFDSTIGVHFVALFSRNPKATPLLLLHGWPGSFLEFLPILAILRSRHPDPSQLPYHVIVPSLPGYGLSDAPPLDRNFGIADVSRIIDHVVVQGLGLTGYVTQAGDVGSRVARILAAQYQHCRGTLLNFSPTPPPPSSTSSEGASAAGLPEHEKQGLERQQWFVDNARAYALMHATRPATTGLVLSSSPLAVLAWVGEKFLDWSDPASFPPSGELPGSGVPYSKELMEEILVSTSLYWLTDHVHTCFYPYRESNTSLAAAPDTFHVRPENQIRAPKKLGYTYFPLEIAPMPRSWVEQTGDLVYWKAHDSGGHFSALEQPEVLLADIDEFVKQHILGQ